MNRFAPLIVRRSGSYSCAAAAPRPQLRFERAGESPGVTEELRLFATTFIAGFVFFGTYLA